MKQHEISVEYAIELMGNYYSHNSPAMAWEKTTEESVNKITQVFKGEGGISVFTSHRHLIHTCNNICLINHYSRNTLQDRKWKNR